MSNQKQNQEGNANSIMIGLEFRGIQDERDYPILLDINLSSRKADNDSDIITLEDLTRALAPSDTFNPSRDFLIASLTDEPGIAIGYSTLGWYSSDQDTQLFYQNSRLRQEYRGQGYWQTMVLQNEMRLREIAAGQPALPHRFYQSWASDNMTDWIAVLHSLDYKVVRRFNNMLYPLGIPPNKPLPAGFEIRPVKPEHMHSIWLAQKEMNDGLFENVAEDWLEEKYPAWLENAADTHQYWQVAWDGDELTGMVLAHIDEKQNQKRGHKRGYTEHIFVRPQWRSRGLASALIAQSLQVLKDAGMQEAELGVDSENESAAYQLYQKLGYKTFSIDTWFRKPMDKF